MATNLEDTLAQANTTIDQIMAVTRDITADLQAVRARQAETVAASRSLQESVTTGFSKVFSEFDKIDQEMQDAKAAGFDPAFDTFAVNCPKDPKKLEEIRQLYQSILEATPESNLTIRTECWNQFLRLANHERNIDEIVRCCQMLVSLHETAENWSLASRYLRYWDSHRASGHQEKITEYLLRDRMYINGFYTIEDKRTKAICGLALGRGTSREEFTTLAQLMTEKNSSGFLAEVERIHATQPFKTYELATLRDLAAQL